MVILTKNFLQCVITNCVCFLAIVITNRRCCEACEQVNILFWLCYLTHQQNSFWTPVASPGRPNIGLVHLSWKYFILKKSTRYCRGHLYQWKCKNILSHVGTLLVISELCQQWLYKHGSEVHSLIEGYHKQTAQNKSTCTMQGMYSTL